MEGSWKNSFLIKGSKLVPWRENHYNFQLCRKHYQIIKGTVYTKDQTPCAGATVQITEIDEENEKRSLLGFSVTDEAGHYLFSLDAKPQMKYELTIFAPMIPS